MPLAEITNSQLNSQELDSAPRKRTIAEFFVERKSDDAVCNNSARGAGSPTKSSPGLTASGSSPLERNSPSPNVTPKRLASQELLKDAQKLPASEPPAKRKKTTKKATPEEVAAKAAAEEAKKKEKEAKDAARLAVEEAKKKEKEEKEAAKEAAKAEKEAIKIKKAEEAKKAAEERERKRLEKEAKKLGLLPNQKKLTDMFGMGPSTPKKSQPVVKAEIAEDVAMTGTPGSPAMENVSYRKRFQPFFVKEHVTLASYPYEMDEETREAKSRILCEYVDGERQIKAASLSENVLDLLQIPSRHRRGRVYPSVRSIMTKYHGNTSSNAIDLTSESQKTKQITHTLEALKAVPVKSLKFREDVRPPYIGTISGLPPGVKSLKVIARHPTARVTALNYDYDSEGEWQEDDGEDVEDLDDDEEDADADEEMEDFLDDSEDVGPARLVFSGGMEPENTGLCWESRKRLNSPARLYKFRMEFILESLPHHHSVDPFSDSYWKPAVSETTTVHASETVKPLLASAKSTSPRTKPMPAPKDALQALTQTAAAANKKLPKPLSADLHDKLKQYLRDNPTISKVGLIEFFSGQHDGCAKASVKASFELLTVMGGRAGRGKKQMWQLRDDV